jgi:hypothetical protein
MASMKLFVCLLLCALAAAADNKPVISLDLSDVNGSPVQQRQRWPVIENDKVA